MGVLAWNCIAIQLMYCKLRDIAEDKLVAIQKNCIVRNIGKRQGCLCRKTGNCVTTRRWARQQARAGALGRRRACWGTQGERAGARRESVLGRAGRACWGAQGERAGARRASVARAAGGRWVGARARASGSWVQAQAGDSGARGARGWALGARQGAGRAGWPWAVHSVHSTYFRSVFRLSIFPESLNEHCSL